MRKKYSVVKIFIFNVVSALLLISPAVSPAMWKQANENGFGDIENSYVPSMIVFENQLYAGTCNITGAQVWLSPDGITWDKGYDAAEYNPSHVCVQSMTIFNNELWGGTCNYEEGFAIGNSSGTVSIEGGFGDQSNICAASMAVFNNRLFVGTSKESRGCEVWSSPDGTSWMQANEDGFGDENNFGAASIAIFGNYLYVGASNFNGCQIWRTAAVGEPPFKWDPVITDGFGDITNIFAFSMVVFNNWLYVGTGNICKGCQIWRTAAVGEPPFIWEKVNIDGFGNYNNHHATSMVVFDDHLYVATSRDKHYPTHSCKVWRTAALGDLPFNDWRKVNSDEFGNHNNTGAGAMTVFHNYLYVGTGNYEGCEVWQYKPHPVEIIFEQYSSKVPKRGELGFQATVTNNTNRAGTVYFATKVKLPNGNLYPPSGYLVGPIKVTLDPYESKSKRIPHNIPINAPLGDYTYNGYIGKPGVGVINDCQFNFEVVEKIGSISGEITCPECSECVIRVNAYGDIPGPEAPILGEATIKPSDFYYKISGLPLNTEIWVLAWWSDLESNPWLDCGDYIRGYARNPIILTEDNPDLEGIDITLKEISITGEITCTDCSEGLIQISAWDGEVGQSNIIGYFYIDSPGYFFMYLPHDTEIWIAAWWDKEQEWNPPPDAGDYVGEYGGNPIILTEDNPCLSDININLEEVRQ